MSQSQRVPFDVLYLRCEEGLPLLLTRSIDYGRCLTPIFSERLSNSITKNDIGVLSSKPFSILGQYGRVHPPTRRAEPTVEARGEALIIESLYLYLYLYLLISLSSFHHLPFVLQSQEGRCHIPLNCTAYRPFCPSPLLKTALRLPSASFLREILRLNHLYAPAMLVSL